MVSSPPLRHCVEQLLGTTLATILLFAERRAPWTCRLIAISLSALDLHGGEAVAELAPNPHARP